VRALAIGGREVRSGRPLLETLRMRTSSRGLGALAFRISDCPEDPHGVIDPRRGRGPNGRCGPGTLSVRDPEAEFGASCTVKHQITRILVRRMNPVGGAGELEVGQHQRPA